MYGSHGLEKSHWNFDDIRYGDVDIARVREREELFILVCSASFIESCSDIYTHNLVTNFSDDPEIAVWLSEQWQPEELQHGRALKAYVQHVWPEFDWNLAFADLLSEYSKLCSMEKLEPTRAQEMVSRCIVEMGTATYYQALHAVCDEPILQDLAWRIRNDELKHYKHFYRYFLKYQNEDPISRSQVVAALWRRLVELRQTDTKIAIRYANKWRCSGSESSPSFEDVSNRVFGLMRVNYPIQLAVQMTLKPLQLNTRLRNLAERPLAMLARRVLRS
ncbi:ferritin-like domain-containing protein [Caballeronia sordidicola]|uniref:Ferritin n=1 Tax=Caballeronia sordidicola TaxID=196367 RepID=A0A226X2Z6_CABSO|nr:ferritin-like domain-containing protein [Caballeronia sordidicola]OXC77489.1 hypothetical protein BSU04_16620 [Caballeronia sordidicola]